MKKQSNGIQILNPAAYWEKKLGINYDTEIIRYKYLCMKKLTKKQKCKMNAVYYITYTNWEQKMLDSITSLDRFELYEYIHFLNGRANNRNIILTLTSGYVFPFVMGIFCPYIVSFMVESIITKDGKLFIGIFCAFFYVIYKISKFIKDALDDSLSHSFYIDLMHIAQSQYEKT